MDDDNDLVAQVIADLSPNALATLAAIGATEGDHDGGLTAFVASDLAAAGRRGWAEKLLARCLDGVESGDVESGWREYVRAVEIAWERGRGTTY